ncbi:DUF6318 family protein [Nocardioides aquiterrae]
MADVTGTRAVIAAVGVALVLGAACSGSDPEPRLALPSSSAPSTPSTSPASSQTAPTLPPEAKGTDAKAAEAFVKFYWEMVNYAQRTGDVGALQALGPDCGGCDAGIAFITDVYDRGGSIRGGEGHLTKLSTGFIGKNHDRAVVRCHVVTTEQNVDLPGTKHDKTYSGGDQPFQFQLDPVESGWVVTFMGAQ